MVQTTLQKSIAEDTQKVAAEVQLQKYGSFFDKFAKKLQLIEKSFHFEQNYQQTRHIIVDFQPCEQINAIQELINSENKIIDKVLCIFCKLCDEVTFLENEAKTKYVEAIIYYGEGSEADIPYEDCQLLISEILPTLQSLSSFVTHCDRVVFDILSQLSAFYRLHFEITDSHLHTMFDKLASLLLVLIMLEEALTNNNALFYHWSLYRRTIQLASHTASELSFDSRKLAQVNKLIDRVETQLLSRKIFANILNLNFEKKSPVKQNKRLEEELGNYMKILQIDLDRLIHKKNSTDMTKLMKLSIIFVVYVNIYGTYDKKLLKSLTDMIHKFPLITLCSHVFVQLDKFIIDHAGQFLKQFEKKSLEKDRQQSTKHCLNDITQRINRSAQYYSSCVLSWMLKLEEKLTNVQTLKTDYLDDIGNLLIDGLNYNKQIKTLLTTASNVHISVNKPMYKMSALAFCKLVEVIKIVESTYVRNFTAIFKLSNYIVQYLQYQCLAILSANKKISTASDKRFKEIRVDTISSLVVAENCLAGPPTRLRLAIITLCLDLASHSKCLNEADRQQLFDMVQKLSVLISLRSNVSQVSSCEFMYWNKNSFPLYLNEIETRHRDIDRVQHLLASFEDGFSYLKRLNDKTLKPNYTALFDEVVNAFMVFVNEPMCRKIEEDLRWHVLSHLQHDWSTKVITKKIDFINFVRSRPLHFANKKIDLRYHVEIYLNKTFYDHATVALHDWHIYAQMRTLCRFKFTLHVNEDGLPNHTLEQGPDLLEITRNIQSFMTNHFYNLNNQIFLESSSNNKHLNVLNIRHIANSIRTHGAGIMNTAVNSTYQFLSTKLTMCSQFLYDEHVKSRLLKEVAFLKESQQDNFKYSHDRAEKLHKGLRKFASRSGENAAYMDQFRSHVTQLGNALGYVRLIRSGGLHYFSNAIGFLSNEILTNSLVEVTSFSNTCEKAAAHLKSVIDNMSHNTTSGTDYFRLLINVFASVIEDPRNEHLLNFYAIVPALTINFVEHMITAKDGLTKKNTKMRVTFTDDGFAMGVAYMLHTLKQYSKFDSLQWFQNVKERNDKMRQELLKQAKRMPKEDTHLNHTLNLSLKRLEIYDAEFQHLYDNLYSAHVLFQDHLKDEENEGE